MSTATKSMVAVTLNAAKHKMVLRGPFNAEANTFYHSLPTPRWIASDKAWTCDATPAAAWRLMNECPIHVEADDDVIDLSSRFHCGLTAFLRNEQPQSRKFDSWPHQVGAYEHAYYREGAGLALRMGEGKTKVAIDLLVNHGAMRSLILCPLSVLGVWRREIAKFAGAPVEVLVLEKGTTKAKVGQAKAFLEYCARKHAAGAVVVNYETAKRDEFSAWSVSQVWDYVILDESHRVKGHSTDVAHYVAALGKSARRRLCLSGTPMASPLDLFSQMRFLDRGLFGTSFHHFRNRYAKMNAVFPGKVDEWINQDELKKRFALLWYRVEGDVLNLPEAIHNERRFDLSPKAKKVYDGLTQNLIADLGTGVVTATNALTRLLRLQQVTSGYTVEDETEVVHEVDDGKESLLGELLLDLPDREPVVVCCRFRHDLDIVKRVAEKLDRRYGEVSGRRKDLTSEATMPSDVDVLAVQIQSGGVGIDLTRAAYCILMSVGFSPIDYEQFLKRQHRPGQKRTTFYYHLIASGTVDEAVYKALKNKQDVIDEVLNALRH